jgi:hypothetical protein
MNTHSQVSAGIRIFQQAKDILGRSNKILTGKQPRRLNNPEMAYELLLLLLFMMINL